MSSSKAANGSIHLRSAAGPIEMRLLDNQFQEVAVGYGEIHERRLPAGLYRLEINAGPIQQKEHISLSPGESFEKLNIHVPFPAAAPVQGTSTTHESHGYPASDLSRAPDKIFGDGGRLLLFFRNVGKDVSATINVEEISLRNAALDPVCDLPAEVIKDEAAGWVALSAEVNPGGYVIRNLRKPQRSWRKESPVETSVDQSIWVQEGWTTIVFIPNWGDRAVPSLRKASAYMARLWDGFHYDDYEGANAAMELGLSGLRQGRPVVPRNLLELMLNEKFQNPMLGIVGAHALLLEPEPRWSLFDTVRRNLKKLVPDHPDVTALHVIGKQQREKMSHSRVKPVSWPPMLHASYRGLIARDADEPGLIKAGSIADRAAANLYQEGPWSIWQSMIATNEAVDDELMDTIKNLESTLSEPTDPVTENLAQIWTTTQQESTQAPGKLSDPEVRQVAQYVQQTTQEASSRKKSSSYRPMDLDDLGRKVGLPVSSVERAITTISEEGFSEGKV